MGVCVYFGIDGIFRLAHYKYYKFLKTPSIIKIITKKNPRNPKNPKKIPKMDPSQYENINLVNTLPNPQQPPSSVDQNLQAIYKEQIKSAIYGQWKQIPYPLSYKEQNIVIERTDHCQFYYKNCIYFYGGKEQEVEGVGMEIQKQKDKEGGMSLTESGRKQSLWTTFHKFNTSSKEFSKQVINYGAHAGMFANISQFGWAIVGNLLFLFGGCNSETNQKRPPEIFSINLDNSTLKRYQSKTSPASIPSPRTNPQLLAIQKSLLLVFGGESSNQKTLPQHSHHNDMYTFKLETKSWVKIQEIFNQKIPVLVRPFLCTFLDTCVYVFGGRRLLLRGHNKAKQKGEEMGEGNEMGEVQVVQEVQEVQEDAVYKLKIAGKSVNLKIDCYCRKVATGGLRKSSNLINTGVVDENLSKIGGFVKYGDRGAFIVEQNKQDKNGSNISLWYFDLPSYSWIQVAQKYDDNLPPQSLTFTPRMLPLSTSQKLYLSQPPHLYQFCFSQTFLQSTLQSLKNIPKAYCSLCAQELSQLQTEKHQHPFLEQYCQPLQFPYQAIGLLIDNSISTGARNCSVLVNYSMFGPSGENKCAYLVVEDNGAPGQVWGEIKSSEFVGKIGSFYASIQPQETMAMEDNRKQLQKSMKQIEQKQKTLQKQFSNFIKSHTQPPASIQKPTTVPSSHFSLKTEKDFQKQQQQLIERKQRLNYKKKNLQKEQKFKKFCNNLKIAGIRLGNFVAYACKQKKSQEGVQGNNAAEIRRFYFLRKERDEKNGKEYYVGYAYVLENGNPADPKMETVYKFCTKQFKKQIKIITQRLKSMTSVFLICDLKDIYLNQQQTSNEKQPLFHKQMRIKKKQNDIFYGQSSLLNLLQSNNASKMQQLCDVSLKTYLALLYLNNPDLSLHLSVRENNLEEINTQPFLSTIDRWLTSKKIVEIIKPLDFSDECSVVEVYWFPDFSGSSDTLVNKINGLGFLLNGILIYHKGRLIGRYAVPLGRLLDQLQTENKAGSVFGYLEVKPQYSCNIYNNNLFYPNALEKYFSRIRFVTQYMETKYRDKRTRGKGQDGHQHQYQKVSKRLKNEKNDKNQ